LSDHDKKNNNLGDQVKTAIQVYLSELNGEQPCDVYSMVLCEVEKPLLEAVMEYSDRNQSKASKILGINRNTLRKKLEIYDLT
jgi:Fis family transcriptional regulator